MKRADLGICDLTITSDRRKVVDFTKPFMSLGNAVVTFSYAPPKTNLTLEIFENF